MHPLIGHEALRRSLARARRAGTLPQSVLVHGAPGVGKQRLALWLAQLVLCASPTDEGPCGACKPCRLADQIEHPDLHWYFPLPRPKGASSPQKLAEALEAARAEALAERRERPLQPSVGAAEPTGLYLAAAQDLRARAHRRPSMGERQVFVIGDAEKLTPQESSQEAANALLKLLEEPPPGTVLVLTSSEPGALLATIRSRTLPVHLPGLPPGVIERALVEHAGASPDEAARAAALARGSLGRALGFLPEGDDMGPLEALRRQAFQLLRAALGEAGEAGLFQRALTFPPARARTLLPLFDFLEEALRDLAAVAAGAGEHVLHHDARPMLEATLERARLHPAAIVDSLRCLDEARLMAAGNVNPQLVVAGLLADLRRAWRGGGAPAAAARV